MKWALIVVGLLVSAALLVVVIGSMLPVGHVATRAARFRQPPEAVWSAITDVSAYPSWRTDLTKVDSLPAENGHARWIEEGDGDPITFEVAEAVPPRRLVVRIADRNLPFGGSWTYVITPADGGSQLRITENGEVYNPLFRFMSRFVFGHGSAMEKYLTALGRRFGESVTPAEA
jgi:hypothetical protein